MLVRGLLRLLVRGLLLVGWLLRLRAVLTVRRLLRLLCDAVLILLLRSGLRGVGELLCLLGRRLRDGCWLRGVG